MAGSSHNKTAMPDDADMTRRSLLGLPERSVIKAVTPPAPAPATTIQAAPSPEAKLKEAYRAVMKRGAGNLIFYLKMHANGYSNDIGGQFLMKLIYGPGYNLRDPEKHDKGSENYEALFSFFERYRQHGNRMPFTPYEEKCLLSAYEVATPETRLAEISITSNIKALMWNRRQMLLFGGIAALGSLAFTSPALFEYVREKLNGNIARKYERIVNDTYEKAQKEGHAQDSDRTARELVIALRKEGPTVGDIASQIGVVMTLLVLGSQVARIISKGYNQYEDKAEYLIKAIHELCELHLDLGAVPSEQWQNKDASAPQHEGAVKPNLAQKHK